MSDRDQGDLDPALRPLCQRFLDACDADPVFVNAGARVFLTQTYRSEADQNADYAKGRTAPGDIVTNARYGESPHNCVGAGGEPAARAFDFGVELASGACDWDASDLLWRHAIAIGESVGLVSGSTWHHHVDAPHLELPTWKINPTPLNP